MKKAIIIFILAWTCLMGYAQRIDPVLEKEMGQRKDDEKIDVFVIMQQQYDREQLCSRAKYFTTKAARREFVVNELKQFSEASQYDIRQSLAEMERNDMVTTPKILWMANALYFSANKQAIHDLARRDDIQVIGFDEEAEPALQEVGQRSVQATREIAPNVLQVNADQVWNLGYTGQGVVVAVIDSGTNYDHFDLRDHLWNGGTAYPHHGWDLGSNDNNPMDESGHGTHCSGTVCGDGGGGVKIGMAPDATLMCVKIAGNASTGTISNGIQWAVEHGCDVFSLSYVMATPSVATKELLRNTCVAALNAGVIGSMSAGNLRTNQNLYPIPNNITFPAGCPPPYLDPVQQGNPGGLSCSVCVGAVDYNDEAAYFTSVGPVTWSNTSFGDYPYVAGSSTQFGLICPDVSAPGVDIVSAHYADNSGYRVLSGTSMAAPCVAGCMALMLSKNPELTPADICRILEETAVSSEPGKSNITGYGRVDVLAAINAVPENLLSLASYVIHDDQGNNNQQIDAGEALTMDMDLRCGPEALNNATLQITTTSDDVTITNGTIPLPNFAAGQTQTVTGFAFTVHEGTPIRRKMTFYADVLVGGSSVGHFAFTLAVQGKTMVYESSSLMNDSNENGTLEPGETANIHLSVNNIGNLTAPSVSGTLSTSSQYLNIHNPNVSFGDVGVYEPVGMDVTVTLASNATNAFPIPFTLNLVDAEGQTSELTFSLFNITTTAQPQGAGNVTGAGTYGTGETIVLTAHANDNYVLKRWKKGNTVASYTDFSVTATENANYVAYFDAVSDAVIVGQAITSSELVPTYSYYNYSLTEQIYTTEELGEAFDISSVSFFNAGTAKTRNCRVFLKATDKSVFQSSNDWVAVTSADKLFEGDITFSSGGWTTVNCEHAFAYDGIHNVLLVIDDNTGTYSRGMQCRVFEDTDDRAIYISSDNTNFNPYNPSGENGYYVNDAKHKSQVLFGRAADAVEENPTEQFCFVRDGVLYVNTLGGKWQLSVIDVMGRMVKSVELTGHSCSVADLPAGVYVVRLTNGTTSLVQKVLVGE